MGKTVKADKTFLRINGEWLEFKPEDFLNNQLPKFKDAHILKFLRKLKKQEIKDYEAFDLMHKYDGTFSKSDSGLSSL